MTRQRTVILEELRKVTSHPTADELYTLVRKRMPQISLGTVYRNLDLLTEAREVLTLESAGSMCRFDGNTQPHRHVRCVHCGRVADVHTSTDPAPAFQHLTVDDSQVTNARIEYDGICAVCEKSSLL
jgi:Fur family ferric uptake transcriptional regulator